MKQEDFSDITATAKHQFRDQYAREGYQLQKILQLRPTSMHTMTGGYHKTVLYMRQSGGDVLIIGVYAHRTRYDDVLCGYTNTCIWCDKSRYMTSHVVLVVITTF